MCLNPRLIPNKKYLPNKKNNFNPPVPKDRRLLYVAAACGYCSVCLQKKSKEWSFRLLNEYYYNSNHCYFVTLTFNDNSLDYIKNKYKIKDENEICSKAIRLFLERYRKHNKKYFKHFFISELGEKNGRIHLHGIIFNFDEINNLDYYWKFGYTYIGKYVNEKSVNYILKYILKSKDDFKPKIFASKGLGSSILKNNNFLNQTMYKGRDTKDYYKLPNGKNISLPVYLRNKIYKDEEKEEIWLNKLDKKEVYVKGIKFSLNSEKEINEYYNTLKYYSNIDKMNGYISKDKRNYINILKRLNLI